MMDSKSEVYIILGIIGTFCMVHKTASSPCGAHICLNWKIQNNRLVLICKVDALNFPITFYDPFNTETGFCVPHEPCISLLNSASITKNNTKHEIVVTIPLQIHLNGWWTCKYGDNNERAVTEVTIQNNPLKTTSSINEISQITKCWILLMLWCTVGYVCAYLLIRLIIVFLTINTRTLDFKRNRVKTLIAFSLSVTIFVLPVIVGQFEVELCSVPQVFVIYGAIIGLTSSLLLNYIDQNGLKSYTLLIKEVEGEKLYNIHRKTGQKNNKPPVNELLPDSLQEISYEASKGEHYSTFKHASHAMLFTLNDTVLGDTQKSKAAIMMLIRFDGSLGFPGGSLHKNENPLTGINRKLQKQIGPYFSENELMDSNHVTSFVNKGKHSVFHFYGKKVPANDLSQIVMETLSAPDYGNGRLGVIHPPLYTKTDGWRGLPAFLCKNFEENSREELCIGLQHFDILKQVEFQKALAASNKS